MDVKNFLYAVRREQKELKILCDRIREAREALLLKGIRYDTEKVQTSPSADAFPDTFANIDEYVEKLQEAADKLVWRRTKAIQIIMALPTSEERAVLVSFFLSEDSEKKMKDVARELSCSERQAYRIYENAIEHLRERQKDVSECQ